MVHLLDSQADFQLREMAAAVAGDSALTIGRGGALRDVWTAARYVRARRGPVHAWGNRALIAAALAKSTPLVYTPPAEMTRRAWAWSAWIARRRDATVICATEPVRNVLCQTGIAPDRCRLIRPGAVCAPGKDFRLRQQLGLSGSDFVVLAPGESTRAAEHNLAVWATAIPHELDPTWKLLLWGRGPLARQVSRLGRKLKYSQLLYFAPRRDFAHLATAADAAIYTARSGRTLGVAICMAAGLPAVRADAGRTASSLSRKLIALRDDAAYCAASAAREKADAQKLFGMERFLQQHCQVYSDLGIQCRCDQASGPLARYAGRGLG